MEGTPEQEKFAAIGLDEYLAALPLPYEFEGQLCDSRDQAFYWWVSTYYPKLADVDGVSLYTLYEKNVLDVGMSEANFEAYCGENQFPMPNADSKEPDFFEMSFRIYLNQQERSKVAAYEAWAHEHGILTAPGSNMRFTDAEGNPYRVSTATKTRGQILVE